MDIVHPDKGFFGYLLRCKCPKQEDVSGNFIFLDDGIDCYKRFPSVKNRREEIRAEWNGRISRYHDIFQGQLCYVNEELIEDFIDFMTYGSDNAVRIFLEKFTAEVRASAIYDGLKPLYAVSHVCQLSADIDVQLRTSEHRSMYSYVRLSIDRCTARTSEHRRCTLRTSEIIDVSALA